MARETKVGLLAGLAFIVCFAIILTNRGRQGLQASLDPTTGQHVVDRSSSNQPPMRNSSDVRTNARKNVPRRNYRATPRPDPARSINNTQPPRSYRANGVDQSGVARTGKPRETKISQQARLADASVKTNLTSRQQPRIDRRNVSPSNSSLQMGNHLGNRQSGDHNLRQLELRIAQLTNQLESAKKGSTPATKKPAGKLNIAAKNKPVASYSDWISRKSKSGSLKYVVVAGDTLSKIAKTYYGHSTKHYIDQIVGANGSVLADPNVVHVGDELFLPGVPVVKVSQVNQTIHANPAQVAAAERKMKRASNRTNRKSSTPSTWKWYEIKKNDRYISIARKQLGDARRWPEIHELNKDKFSDPSRIRVGVRIKLPTITLARATQERSH